VLSAPLIASAVAIVTDVVREVRFSRTFPDATTVWPEHRPYAAEAIASALDKARIPVLLRNRDQRTMLQFFAAYVPIDICVPALHRERAAAIAERVLAPRENDRALRAKLKGQKGDPIPWSHLKKVAPLLAFILAAGIGVVVIPRQLHEHAAKTRHSPRTKLAFSTVDDDADPLGALEKARLPAGVRISIENPPVGGGRLKTTHYAEVIPQEGETMDQALARTRPFFEGLKLPEGDSIGFERMDRYDEDTGSYSDIGYRTFLLVTTPVLDERDVADAIARPQDDSRGGKQWVVMLEFTHDGSERFEEYTAAHVQRRFAIVTDGMVMSAPVIQAKIAGGTAQITMGAASEARQKEAAKSLAQGLGGE
jgi:hypothetical protein